MKFKLMDIFIVAGLILSILSCQTKIETIKQTEDDSRYKVAVCDWMILKRQKLSAFDVAKEINSDGLEVDLGGLGSRPSFDNKLLDPIWRKTFQKKSAETGIDICSIAMSGFYAQNFAHRDGIERIMNDAINTMVMMGVKTAFLPLGVEGDLVRYPDRRDEIIQRLKLFGKKAEAAGVVIGIETAFNATEEAKFLDEIGSPAIKSYFNFSNAIQNHCDISDELKILGKDRIAMIHASGKDSVWIEDDPNIDLIEIKKTLDQLGWTGWLVIERSRDASQPRNVTGNYGANVAYLKRIFQKKIK